MFQENSNIRDKKKEGKTKQNCIQRMVFFTRISISSLYILFKEILFIIVQMYIPKNKLMKKIN